MSDKAWCPACDASTSDNARARSEGQPCPHCGLPADAAEAVEAAMERGANEDLAQRAAQAEQRAAKAEHELTQLRGLVSEARRVLERGV